jgi:hypothetical protein
LLFDDFCRAFNVGSQEIAAMAGVVDALHDRARTSYERYGCQRVPDNEIRLVLPTQTIGQLLEDTVGKRSFTG